MSEKAQLITLLFFLIAFFFELTRSGTESCRPRYIKPKSFFRMIDSDDGLLQITAEDGIAVRHHYANTLWMTEQDVETNTENKHNMLCSEV